MGSIPACPCSLHPRTPAADSYVAQLRQTQLTLQTELLKARKAMELTANRKRRQAANFIQGQQVWLLRRHISTMRPSSKVDVRRLGPFPIIEQVGTSAFRLDLPRSMHIHLVFHVSLLEPHVANTFPSRNVAPPPPLHVDGLPEFEVHKILDSKFRRRKLHNFVDWICYTISERSWEPAINLLNAKLAIDAFHLEFPLKPRLL